MPCGSAGQISERGRFGGAGLAADLVELVKTVKVEKQLAANGIDHGAVMAEGEARSGAHEAGFKQRVGHAGHSFHGQDGVANGGSGNIVFAKDAQGSELTQILEGVSVLLGDESGSFPPLQLVGTDLQNAQNVLTAIAGHS